MRSRLVLALLIAAAVIRADDQPNHFVVLSMPMGKDDYRFSLLSAADYWDLVKRAHGYVGRPPRGIPGTGYLPDASALKRSIATWVPEGSTIEWRGWEDTCYPPQPLIDDIRAFAASRHIDVRIQRADEAEIKLRVQKLVDRHATLSEAAAEFGTPQLMTRSQVTEQLQRIPVEDKRGRELWQRLAQYPKTLCFSPGELHLYVFLDDAGGVVAYYYLFNECE